MASYLGIDEKQFSTIDELVDRSTEESAEEDPEPQSQGLFGMENKLQNAGINIGSFGKSLLGMIGPALLGGMLMKGMGSRSNRGNTGGGLGGMLGGLLGGGGRQMGGLGSIISMLNGGRGIKSSGGLLGKYSADNAHII